MKIANQSNNPGDLLMSANDATQPLETKIPTPSSPPNITSPPAPSRKAVIIGWIIGILPILMLIMSAVMKFAQPADVVKGFDHLGWPLKLAIPLGIIELTCSI